MKTKSDVIVDFFVFEDMDGPLLTGVNGAITLDELEVINKEFQENHQDIGFGNNGNYEIRCIWYPGQYGEYGMCEIAPGWEFDLISYEPIPELGDDELMEVGE